MPPSDLTNISSRDWLQIWDDYVCAILDGCHASHGAHPANLKGGAEYIAQLADAMMVQRQMRAQEHIDQAAAERESAKTTRKSATK